MHESDQYYSQLPQFGAKYIVKKKKTDRKKEKKQKSVKKQTGLQSEVINRYSGDQEQKQQSSDGDTVQSLKEMDQDQMPSTSPITVPGSGSNQGNILGINHKQKHDRVQTLLISGQGRSVFVQMNDASQHYQPQTSPYDFTNDYNSSYNENTNLLNKNENKKYNGEDDDRTSGFIEEELKEKEDSNKNENQNNDNKSSEIIASDGEQPTKVSNLISFQHQSYQSSPVISTDQIITENQVKISEKVSKQDQKCQDFGVDFVLCSIIGVFVQRLKEDADSYQTEIDSLCNLTAAFVKAGDDEDLLLRFDMDRRNIVELQSETTPYVEILSALCTGQDEQSHSSHKHTHVIHHPSSQLKSKTKSDESDEEDFNSPPVWMGLVGSESRRHLRSVFDLAVFVRERTAQMLDTLSNTQQNYLASLSLQLSRTSNQINFIAKDITLVSCVIVLLQCVASQYGMNIILPFGLESEGSLWPFVSSTIVYLIVIFICFFIFKCLRWDKFS
ncbi:MAG: hypothetical protein EZS28_022848 [Streblomastix strix]|uniref:Uncharacterized protein n=1 Tax=Streblomastix strix TaxID=222440 RepID=A0A5J4VGA6_9EUKA|nr:MAG: hypothetical protein EZS28_022848 [Streblomastix strix]